LLRFARNDDHRAVSHLSSPAKAGDPVLRGVNDGIEKLRRTGYPACAGYDGSWWSRRDVLSRMSRSLPSGPHSRDPLARNDETAMVRDGVN
jgi:hypothetical protein